MPSCGQKTVSVAGTEVALGSQEINGPLAIKALPSNTGVMYIGNNGNNNVSSTTGFPLSAGDVIILDFVKNLDDIMVNATVNGEGVAWLTLQHEGF